MISILVGIVARSPWGIQAMLYTIAALLIVNIGLGVTVKIQSARLDADQARQEALGGKLAEQNRAVAKWKAEADLQTQRVKDAAQKAEKVRIVTVDRIRTVTVAAIPPACPDAIKWGAEHALEFNKHWEGEE